MNEHELTLLRRKTILGTVAVICWALAIVAAIMRPNAGDPVGPFFVVSGWLLTALWVALDASMRARNVFFWTVVSLAASPLAVLIYAMTSPPNIAVCAQCGNRLPSLAQPCPICGTRHVAGRVSAAINQAYSSLADSLMRAPVEQAKNTTRAIAIALGVAALFSLVLANASGGALPLVIILVLSFAAYWVLVPWWVYLDASWRRMEPIPWALLALMTNAVGLVTYLVIRYPDPRSCPKCGTDLPVGLKRCPYCGSEAEPTCPRCQSPIRPDWVYCPSCASQLPAVAPQQMPGVGAANGKPPAISISGSVVDGLTGLPLEGVEVRVDSRDLAASTVSDSAGRFLLSELDPRPYVLIASTEGYASSANSFTPTAVGAGQCHFTLMPSRTQAEAETQGVTSKE